MKKTMKKKFLYFSIIIYFLLSEIFLGNNFFFFGKVRIAQAANYNLNFSTYFGGAGYDEERGITTDNSGNIYITGTTESDDFPTTVGAYKRGPQCKTGTPIGSAGYQDGFVAKFSPAGQLIWSTLFGGCYYDKIYGVKVDSSGYVYIHGRGYPDIVPTPGSFQTTCYGFTTDNGGAYGPNNAWIAKLTPDGSSVVWQTCFGTGYAIRDMDIDENDDLYVATGYFPIYAPTPHVLWPSWFTTSYRKTPYGGNDVVVAKIKGDGTQVYWASYIGGAGSEGDIPSIAHGPDHSLYAFINTSSTDMPITSGAVQASYGGGTTDAYIARFSSDGTTLSFGTYLGGSGAEYNSTHNLLVDSSGNAYLAVYTSSSNFPTTVGVFQRTYGGGASDIAIAKISSDGKTLMGSTFIGCNGQSNTDGIHLDSSNNIYVSGNTNATNFPYTSDAYQKSNAGGQDGLFMVLRSDFTSLLYGTYIGGSADDMCRTGTIDNNLNFFCAGVSLSDNFPKLNAYQSSRAGDNDVILVKLSPVIADTTPPVAPTGITVI